jgi:hypothetical protein
MNFAKDVSTTKINLLQKQQLTTINYGSSLPFLIDKQNSSVLNIEFTTNNTTATVSLTPTSIQSAIVLAALIGSGSETDAYRVFTMILDFII